jgi:hypothetical protein
MFEPILQDVFPTTDTRYTDHYTSAPMAARIRQRNDLWKERTLNRPYGLSPPP